MVSIEVSQQLTSSKRPSILLVLTKRHVENVCKNVRKKSAQNYGEFIASLKRTKLSYQPSAQKVICEFENKPFKCDNCGIIDFESSVSNEVVLNFVNAVKKLSLSYEKVCDKCRFQILYEFYKREVTRVWKSSL